MKLPVDYALSGPVKSYALPKKSFSSGFIFAIFANLLWGTSFLASKYTLLSWGPFTSSGLRFGIATIALFIALRLTGKKIEIPKNREQWLGLFIIGTTGFGLLYPLQLAGMRLIPSSLSAAIMLVSPLLVLVFGRAILNEKLSTLKWIALILGLTGGSLLISSTHGTVDLKFDGEFVFGSVLTLLSAASLAGSVIATRRYSKYFSSSSLTFWSMAIGFIELTASAFIFEDNVVGSVLKNYSLLSWMGLLFLALVCSSFCFFIWNYALSKTSPQDIASSMHIKTPTAVLIGVLIANEALTPSIIIGTSLVMFGVWLSQQKKLGRVE